MLNNAPLLTSEKIFSACANRIRSLSSFISTNDLLCAAKLICEARMCHIIGAGNTIPIASDLVIAISRSGASTQVLKALSLAKKKEMKILVITADPNSQIMDFSDAILQINDTNEMHDQNVVICYFIGSSFGGAFLFDHFVVFCECETAKIFYCPF